MTYSSIIVGKQQLETVATYTHSYSTSKCFHFWSVQNVHFWNELDAMLNLPKVDGHIINFWNELHAMLNLPLLEGHIIHFWSELDATLMLPFLECTERPLLE